MKILNSILQSDFKQIELKVLATLKFKQDCIGYLNQKEAGELCVHFTIDNGECRFFRDSNTGKKWICDDVILEDNND